MLKKFSEIWNFNNSGIHHKANVKDVSANVVYNHTKCMVNARERRCSMQHWCSRILSDFTVQAACFDAFHPDTTHGYILVKMNEESRCNIRILHSVAVLQPCFQMLTFKLKFNYPFFNLTFPNSPFGYFLSGLLETV